MNKVKRVHGFRKLVVWEKADELAFQVYLATKKFPKEEAFGLTSQLRRAVLSIPTNIAEGYGRQGKKELKQFLNIAMGSLSESEYLLHFSHRLNYLTDSKYSNLSLLTSEVGKLLWKFYKSIQ